MIVFEPWLQTLDQLNCEKPCLIGLIPPALYCPLNVVLMSTSTKFMSGKLNDSLDSLNVQNPIISTIYHIYTNTIMSRQHTNVFLKKHQLSP